MANLDTILSVIVGLLIVGAAVYIFRSRKYQRPDPEPRPWQVPLEQGREHAAAEPEFSEEDRRFFEDVLGVDVEEHKEFLRPLAAMEQAQGVHFRDLYESNEELARNFWQGVGQSYFEEKHFDQAAESFLKALGFYMKNGGQETAETAQLRCNLGIALTESGRGAEAVHQLEKSLEFNREHDPDQQDVIASLLNNLGWAWETEGDNAKALDCYEKSMALCEEIGLEEAVENLKPKIDSLRYEQK